MQNRFIPCLIFHNYESEKSGGWVGIVGGGGNITGIYCRNIRCIKALAKKVCRNFMHTVKLVTNEVSLPVCFVVCTFRSTFLFN